MSDQETLLPINRCASCGACCAIYKIVFPAYEAEAENGGWVPVEITERSGPSKRKMKRTDRRHRQCVALEGRIGTRVRCAIYDRRPSSCRNFKAAWQEDAANDQCNRARALYGLPAFGIM
jgi:Fe-S-cluster containining protein